MGQRKKESQQLMKLSQESTRFIFTNIYGKWVLEKEHQKQLKSSKNLPKKAMKTDDVRIDSKLNNKIWAKGVRNVPFRIRVRLSRRRNQDDDSVNRLYTLCQFIPVTTFKGLLTENVESTDE